MYCALCKQDKETKLNWVIYENGAGGVVKKYRVCDECAIHVIKEISGDVLGLREGETLPLPLDLTKVGAIQKIHLLSNHDIEMVINADISQAKRIIEKKLEEEKLKGVKD